MVSNKRKAFTFIEIVIYLIIASTLIVLAVVSYDKHSEKIVLTQIHKNIKEVEDLMNLEEDRLDLDNLSLTYRDNYLTKEVLEEDKVIRKIDKSLSGSTIEDKDNYYKVLPLYLQDNTTISKKYIDKFYYNPDKREVVFTYIDEITVTDEELDSKDYLTSWGDDYDNEVTTEEGTNSNNEDDEDVGLGQDTEELPQLSDKEQEELAGLFTYYNATSGVIVGRNISNPLWQEKYTDKDGNLIFPEVPEYRQLIINGEKTKVKITTISSSAFKNIDFKGDLIAPFIEVIGTEAFWSSSFGGKLDLRSVKTIGEAHVNSAGGFAKKGVFGSANFTEVSFPNVEVIGDRAFIGATSFNGNIFPRTDKLKTVGVEAFKNVVFTGEINLPSIEKISRGAFYFSKFVGEFISDTIIFAGDAHSNMDSTWGGAFQNSNFSYIEIPNVEIVGDKTFFSSSVRKRPLVPMNNLKKVGHSAFKEANFYGSFQADNVTDIKTSAFESSQFIGNFTSNKLERIGSRAFELSEFTGDLNLPNLTIAGKIYKLSHTSTFGSPFGISSFDSIYMPNVKILGDKVFQYTSVTKEMLDNLKNVEEIGYEAFGYNLEEGPITNLDLPMVTYIKGSAFSRVKLAGRLSIPNITEVGPNAFNKPNFTSFNPNDTTLIAAINNNVLWKK